MGFHWAERLTLAALLHSAISCPKAQWRAAQWAFHPIIRSPWDRVISSPAACRRPTPIFADSPHCRRRPEGSPSRRRVGHCVHMYRPRAAAIPCVVGIPHTGSCLPQVHEGQGSLPRGHWALGIGHWALAAGRSLGSPGASRALTPQARRGATPARNPSHEVARGSCV